MNKRILIVDDEPHIVKMLKARLLANGFNVETANDGKEGLLKTSKFKPDLIILDIMMPEMDGSIMASKLKENPETANTKIIFLTALVKKDEEAISENLIGGNHFIAKPYDPKKLIDLVKELLA